ncbi:MAG: ATP-binding protein [Myxococcota bacterium]
MIYVFGDFELDDRLFQLRRCGEPLRVEPRVLDLLLFLVRNPDRVVSRDELTAEVWEGVALGESAIPTAVNALRKVLAAAGDEAPIKTVYGRGYRFCAPVAVRDEQAPARAGPGPSGGAQDVFIGRRPALARLGAALERAQDGRGGLCLLVGEPGIGKTRTAEHIAGQARARGFWTGTGRCPEEEGEPPYWTWARALRPLLATCDPLSAAGRPLDLSALALLLPEVPANGPAGPEDGELHRFRMFDAVSDWLAVASRSTPLLVFIDDLQWADPASLELLTWVARDLASQRILVLATLRSNVPEAPAALTRTLGAIARLDHAERIELEGLDEEEVGEFLDHAAGFAAPELVRALRERSDGNPFFLRETLRLLAARGSLDVAATQEDWSAQIPPAVRDVVRARLAPLSESASELLHLAAAAGRDFPIALVAQAAGRPREDFLGDLDRAVASQLLVPVPGQAGWLRFGHAIVRDTLLAELAPGDRATRHEHIADALLAQGGDGPDAPAAEIAHHLYAAAARGRAAEAADWAERAARAAVGRSAFEEAAAHAATALDALGHTSDPSPERRLELLLLRGDAQLRAGDAGSTRETFAAAADLARSLDRVDDFIRAALGYGGSVLWGNTPDGSELALLDEAARRTAETEPALRAKLLARQIAVRAGPGSHEEERPATEEVLNAARESDDAESISEALHTRHFVLQGPDHLEEREALALEILEIGESLGRLDRTFAIRETLAADRLIRGDRRGFLETLASAERAARASHHPAFQWLSTAAGASAALLEGRFADAEQAMAEAAEFGQRARNPQALALNLGQTIALRRAQGRLEEILPVYERIAPSLEWMGPFPRVTLAMIYQETGAPEEARRLIEQLAPELPGLSRRADWLISLTELAHVCAGVGDRTRAGQLEELLRPHAKRHAVYPGPLLYAGPVCHALARLAAVRDDRDAAGAWFEDALGQASGVGARPSAARIRCDWAEMLGGSPRPEDRERARQLGADAAAQAEALEMTGLSARAAALARRSGA